MDLDEFERLHRPGKRRSQMHDHLKAIHYLKQRGYADRQISEWLATQGVTVSRESVRMFLVRHPVAGGEDEKGSRTVDGLAAPSQADLPQVKATDRSAPSSSQESKPQPAKGIRQIIEEQNAEAESSMFKMTRDFRR